MEKRELKVYKDGREPVMLRLPPALKARIVEAARKNRRSVTAEVELALQKEYGR
jgi:hypothetical protein